MSTLVLLLVGCRSNTCVGLGEQETDVERVGGSVADSWSMPERPVARTLEEWRAMWAALGNDPDRLPDVDLLTHQVVFVLLTEGSCGAEEDDVLVGFFADGDVGLVASIESPTCGSEYCADAMSFGELWETPIAPFSTCQRAIPCPNRDNEVFPW